MAWDFSTEPEFQKKLDWVEEFCKEEVEPLEYVFPYAVRSPDPHVKAYVRGLQQQVKDQGLWAIFLVLPRTYDPGTRAYGNLYNNLLDYVISAALIFYILTIAGIFRLRRTRPNEERPYRAFGYPFVPALYIAGASVILILLFAYRTSTTVPGLVIVLIGVPVYFILKRRTH